MASATISPEKKKFIAALCAEHLDEAAFLYAQCRHLLDGSSAPWPNAEQFEHRLGAHLDALSIEGAPALDACQTRTGSSDPGDLYAATRIFCQNDQPDRIGKIIDHLAPDNEKKFMALCSALIDEALCHPQRVLDILATHPEPARVSAKVAGGARLNGAWPVLESPQDEPPDTLAPILRLSGRICKADAALLLIRSLDHADENVRAEAALALLRLGKGHDVLGHCRSNKRPLLALGLGGGRSEVSFLMQLTQSGPVTPELLISLGLLGDISAISILTDGLDNETLAESAAQALELITGAGVKERIFVPDPIDKKELFKPELEKLDQGQSPYPAGKTPGVTTNRISRDPGEWKKWLGDNNRDFIPGARYRNGQPYSPRCLIDNMKSETFPGFIRQLAYEELVIRYKQDFPFETDRPASFQKRAIAEYEAWEKTADKLFYKGQWYFAGRLMT